MAFRVMVFFYQSKYFWSLKVYFKNYLENISTPNVKISIICRNDLVFKFFDDKHKYPDWKMSFIYFLRLFSKDVFSPYTILPTVLCAQK